jgi:hypothetical protein
VHAGAKALGLTVEEALARLGKQTVDVYLNDSVLWRNVPQRAWEYTIGGYQVLKKWLSYRENEILGRGLALEEVREVQDIARRLTALCLLGPELDQEYGSILAEPHVWAASD